ncbi:hypothetical protein SAMN06265368_0294 [Cohaesibacter gelatinilyticus]|uniref:EthD domain-containing protein n=2 Tax=Cohaesibacter gelatinilyticus TaxID=372072 RepID=A0A285N9G9_9HYPH|nr:hypothetical protein SAMN06265368_0294 [Cohaesibacter gelatinilyticus]
MLKRDLGPVSIMGFARYKLKKNVDPQSFVSAAHTWQTQFLAQQDGIAMHCVLGNLSGEFADVIFATDNAAFAAMSEAHLRHSSSASLMAMLDKESIQLTRNELIGGPHSFPASFSCVEFGSFHPEDTASFSEDKMMAASAMIEQNYLSRFNAPKAHFMGKTGEHSYSEITFFETLGEAQGICQGYVNDDDCQPLLNLIDPASVDLDFWFLLA